ncbi:hypothetical protein X781_4050 [Mannheimia sp. USDA-ARS-USMARC-1261]|uniref:hypothetical protein n=1 Tax=Mannheimia sp. USDA-ARS-USMARC-1261 TaxID=1432056 RepID=UPI0003E3AA8F|nr:hypothetical protein [Mannheimia sp. USDA-ARS-USMARC-1261]AHG72554.1 hypothetical protein X781_4050 [Mannheimia sp. USDA-ARS-USMARC-1261]
MFIKKLLFILTAISLFVLNVQATENNQAAKTEANKTETKKMETKQAEDKNLKAFNQNVRINLIQRGTAKQDNQDVAVLTYEVNNIGKNRIKNLNWLSAFTINNQIFFVQEVQTQLDKAISAKKKTNITVVLPINNLPENVKPVFASLETPIGHITVAKQIDFTNGKKIIVKEE